jgi:hypothetical protein
MLLRRRELLVLTVATVGLGARAALAAPAASPQSAESQSSSAASSDWSISGTLQAINGQNWDVQGFAIRVDSATTVTGGVPIVGSFVSATGRVLPGGTWLATTVQIGVSSSPTATSTPTATATPVPTSTPTPTEVEDEATPILTPRAKNTRQRPSVTPRPAPSDDQREADDRNGPPTDVDKLKKLRPSHLVRRLRGEDGGGDD